MIYVFRTHPVAISNLFLAFFMEVVDDLAYDTCRYPITHDGLFDMVEGNFAKQLCKNPGVEFRHINWERKIDQLQHIANSTSKHLIFGSHHPDQITYLKDFFGNRVTTVAINYDKKLYTLLIESMAKNHIWLLRENKLVTTDYDKSLLEGALTQTELVQHYCKAFEELRLIPESINDTFDYNINISDFFIKDKVLAHANQLGFSVSAHANNYYDTWLNSQQAFF